MENQQNSEKPSFLQGMRQAYEKYYKILPLIPAIIVIIALVIIFNFYNTNGDIFEKDVSLKGGITATISTNQRINTQDLENKLIDRFGDANVRTIAEFGTDRQIGVTAEVATEDEKTLKQLLEQELNIKLNENNYSVEIMGSTLGHAFYQQMLTAIAIAFVLMSIVVAFLYRSFIPSMGVILSVIFDIIVAIALIDIFDMRISTTGISALLLLIGYSVDTDILLATRTLKRKESNLMDRVYSSMNTGLTMTITTLVALVAGLLISESHVIQEMFTILIFGLVTDVIITYCMNAPTLIRYAK